MVCKLSGGIEVSRIRQIFESAMIRLLHLIAIFKITLLLFDFPCDIAVRLNKLCCYDLGLKLILVKNNYKSKKLGPRRSIISFLVNVQQLSANGPISCVKANFYQNQNLAKNSKLIKHLLVH